MEGTVGRRSRMQSEERFPSGVLLVDKPGSLPGRGLRGPTSHDVVASARRALGLRAVGHAGTLDPMASGLLVLLLGRATRLSRFAMDTEKVYEAELRLGVLTDSLDAEGEVVRREAVPPLRDEDVQAAFSRFSGELVQRVPAVSAVRVGGKRLHERVRAGERVDAPSRRVVLHELRLLSRTEERLRFWVRCGKGFYVRSLGRDLAEALGTVGHLTALRRLRSGAFRVEEAIAFGRLEEAAGGEEASRRSLWDAVIPLEEAAARMMPSVPLDDRQAEDARHGRPIRGPSGWLLHCPERAPLALLHDGALLAVAERRGERLQVLRGFGA